MLRRIRRRMQIADVEDLPAYFEYLRTRGAEAHALMDDLLITVSSFFRDPEVFEQVEKEVVPALVRSRGPGEQLRAWAVGCATGEEAYGLAMLLMEEAARQEHPPEIQVFASDLHERSLQHAREGLYPDTIEAEIGPERLKRFFVEENGGYRVRKEVRERVIFALHDLLKDPPFSRIDLLTCRNLLIYLERGLQRELIELFHYALRGEGYLLLGSAETLENTELFRAADKKLCLFQRRDVRPSDLSVPAFPRTAPRLRPAERDVAPRPAPTRSYGSLHERMVERYAPPSILVNEVDNVIHVSAHAGRYLQQPGGTPSNHLFRMVRDELRIELRAAVDAAREHKRVERTRAIPVAIDGTVRWVVLRVSAGEAGDVEDFVLVIFDEVGEGEPAPGPAAAGADLTRRDLETELEITRKRLQAMIETYETSKEEMRASNEEMQSTNEELRSTMEELETSREELQSVNEELQTLNQENKHRVEELSQLSGDLQNLLKATDIGVLFLDRSFRIMRFTPRVGELFNIRDSDRGRPLPHLTHRLGYDGLIGDARAVLERLVPVEREVRSEDGRWHLLRIMPYRTAQDRIEGVVVTFVDIDALKRSEEALRRSDERYRLLMENLHDYAIVMLDTDGRIATWNAGAERIFAWAADEVLERPFALLFPEGDADEAAAELRRARAHGKSSDERWHRRVDGTLFWSSGVTAALYEADGALRGFAKVLRDNTERKETEDALRRLNESLEERVRARTAQVREVTSRLTMAEHRERRRISRILHDDLQQVLYGIGMRAELIRTHADKGDTEAVKRQVDQVEEWVAQAVRETRQLTVDLSPPVLQGEGLVEAIGWLRTQMKELHGLDVEIDGTALARPLGQDMRVLLFQIVRELLFNVKKHAGTDRARVELGQRDGFVEAVVTDEGAGFDPAALPDGTGEQPSFGLYSARERLALFGGSLDIDSAPGTGTRIRLRVPLADGS